MSCVPFDALCFATVLPFRFSTRSRAEGRGISTICVTLVLALSSSSPD